MSLLRKWVAIGDPHGENIDPVARSAILSFLKDYQPDILVHGGDNWDFPQLRKKASQKEKDLPMGEDISMGFEFLLDFFRFGTERFFLRGNHDERLWDLAQEGTGDQRQHASEIIRKVERTVQRRSVTMKPYDSRLGVLEVPGMPKVIHGYAHGEGAAKQFAQIYGTCIFCHTHSAEVGIARRYPEPAIAVGTGCLCVIDQPYNSRNTGKLRHENCWAYGYTTKSGRPAVFQARRDGDYFYASSEIKMYQ